MKPNDPETPTHEPATSQVPVTELSASEARSFFLKQTSYTTIELPSYFDFETVLQTIDAQLQSSPLSHDCLCKAHSKSKVNHVLHDNKDGRLSWRPLTLIHPVLYVAMVHTMTDETNWDLITRRFRKFEELENVTCASVPAFHMTPQVGVPGYASDGDAADGTAKDVTPFGAAMSSAWFAGVEQSSLEQALEFNVVVQADISDCYSSIYTHTIPWAIHGKVVAKKHRQSLDLVGNQIDKHIQHMTEGQTCGIPQGSELMNFVAEMVLGYADEILAHELNEAGIEHYKVIRFRDDYRIFVDDRSVAEDALACLYRALQQVQLELRLDKTSISSDVVLAAVREDKRAWLDGDFDRRLATPAESLMNALVRLQNFSRRHPNSGMLKKGMSVLRKRLGTMPKPRQPLALASVLTDIAVRNPKVYPAAASLLSELIATIDVESERMRAVEMIVESTTNAPNTGRLELWLQRIGYFRELSGSFNEALCQLVAGKMKRSLWDNSWLCGDHARVVAECEIVSWDRLQDAPDMLTDEEWDWLLWKISDYG